MSNFCRNSKAKAEITEELAAGRREVIKDEGKYIRMKLHLCNCSGCIRKNSKAWCSKLITSGCKKVQPQKRHSEI